MVKAQFMQLWDGLETRPQGQAPVVVMGATNRPKDVDRAILRRMPSTFHIGFPTAQQRMSILKKILVNFFFQNRDGLVQWFSTAGDW